MYYYRDSIRDSSRIIPVFFGDYLKNFFRASFRNSSGNSSSISPGILSEIFQKLSLDYLSDFHRISVRDLFSELLQDYIKNSSSRVFVENDSFWSCFRVLSRIITGILPAFFTEFPSWIYFSLTLGIPSGISSGIASRIASLIPPGIYSSILPGS